MPLPLVSVALAVHNGENYLAEALDSVLAQTHPHWELVASENCSTDATPTILDDYSRRDARIRWSRTDRLIPGYENVNRAMSLCRGAWIRPLCHDDQLKPHCLERTAAAVTERPGANVGLVGNYVEYLFDNGYREPSGTAADPAPRHYHGRDFLRTALSRGAPDPLPSLSDATVRKDVWQRLGRFNASLSHADTFLWHRVLVDHDLVVIPESLTVIRVRAGQGTAIVRKNLNSIREYRQFFPEFVRAHGRALGLPWTARVRTSIRHLSVAATAIVISLAKGNYRQATEVVRQVPIVWLPVVAGLCVRNFRSEWRRLREMRRHVPLNLLYP